MNQPNQQVSPAEDARVSQTIKAVLGLRGLIIEGKLRPGERVLEQMLVDALGVSRTPARAAMQRVSEEGLMETLPSGGYAVSKFSETDVFDAIAVRGNLEGMAARLAAERGAPAHTLAEMHKIVDELDRVVANLQVSPDVTEYVRLNDAFHAQLQEAASSPMLKRSLERLVVLPFAAPNAFVSVSRTNPEAVRQVLIVSQEQHRSIVEAIENREGTRAEALAIEHSRSAWKYLRQIFKHEADVLALPGMRLVVRE